VSDPAEPLIRHVRYEDFFALVGPGAAGLEDVRRAVDALLREMGAPHHHHVLCDLRGATAGPLPEALLVEAVAYLRRRGLGVANRLAVLVDPADLVRWDRMQALEGIAAIGGLHIRCFTDHGEALDWLSDPDPGA
jgi:hypothetical protein